MPPPSAFTRNLARRLLVASRSAAEPHGNEAVAVSERLRISLTRFAGADGFESLQRRAWVLATAELPALREVTVGKGGRMEGWEQLVAHRRAHARTSGVEHAASQAAVVITAHLLELMVTFIGRPLTLRLVLEAWPDSPLDE